MNEQEWMRIPAPVTNEGDRRTLAAILTAAGLEVRVVKVRATQKSTPKPYIEFREQA